MTQEDKQLLLKDLCARLPYGVKIRSFMADVKLNYDNYSEYIKLNCFKPYLRSMSSMTEEERKEYEHIAPGIVIEDGIRLPNINQINWLNAHHFDYFGLIEKGLAIEAPEGMYKN